MFLAASTSVSPSTGACSMEQGDQSMETVESEPADKWSVLTHFHKFHYRYDMHKIQKRTKMYSSQFSYNPD